MLVDMFEPFRQDYPKQLAEIREAIDTRDAGRTAQVAHSLKGAVGYFGAQTVHALAYQLETIGRRAELDGASLSCSNWSRSWSGSVPLLLSLAGQNGFDRFHAATSTQPCV